MLKLILTQNYDFEFDKQIMILKINETNIYGTMIEMMEYQKDKLIFRIVWIAFFSVIAENGLCFEGAETYKLKPLSETAKIKYSSLWKEILVCIKIESCQKTKILWNFSMWIYKQRYVNIFFRKSFNNNKPTTEEFSTVKVFLLKINISLNKCMFIKTKESWKLKKNAVGEKIKLFVCCLVSFIHKF
jgi:hypothetical protein